MTIVAGPPLPARRPSPGDGPLARAEAWLNDERDVLSPASRPTIGSRMAALGRAHPMAVDALIASALVLLSLRRLFIPRPGPGVISFGVLLVVPLVWRRRYPIGVFVFLGTVALLQWLVMRNVLVADAAVLVALYTVATRAPRRVALLAASTVELGNLVASTRHGGDVVGSMVLLTALTAAAFFLGTTIRTRRLYLTALVERAQRLERERDQQAAAAVAAERASIAREMHDVVAHSLAVMITMADGAALKGRSEPGRAAAAMQQVSETGRQALNETRRLVHVLRTETADGARAPQPGLAQLDPLLEQVRATGLRAELTVGGRPFAVPEGAQLAAYRIVQEALTNTLKHARNATVVRVALRYAGDAVEVDVTDDGAPGTAPTSDGAGHGLVGMRERAALYDGTVLAGPRPGGGWAVHARLELARSLV